MPKNVTFYLGKGGAHLDSRQLQIFEQSKNVGYFSNHLTTQALVNTIETVTLQLDDNIKCRARLQDTVGGVALPLAILDFSTDDGLLDRVYSAEGDGSPMARDLRIVAVEAMSESSASTLSSSRTSTLSSSSRSTLSSS